MTIDGLILGMAFAFAAGSIMLVLSVMVFYRHTSRAMHAYLAGPAFAFFAVAYIHALWVGRVTVNDWRFWILTPACILIDCSLAYLIFKKNGKNGGH